MRRAHTALALAAGFATLFAGAAHADGVPLPAHTPSVFAQECAACHTAYPPGLLPAPAWARIMASLDKHFGTNASVDEKTAAELSRYLASNAGTYKRATATSDARITSAPWFTRKHRDVPAEAWKRPSVVGAFNCSACHSRAAQGDLSDDNARIPK